ncbi:profilin [Parasitella parasitica]|nr:profilin [Parasitella parasitica]
MSWQAYIDTNLVGSGKVSQAGIYGLDGNPWATSPGFKVSNEEVKKIIEGFSNLDSVQANGVYINSNKYFTLKCEDNYIYCKKDNTGACIVKTTQALLIGMYGENMQAGDCNKTVQGLGDYLISVRYVSKPLFRHVQYVC